MSVVVVSGGTNGIGRAFALGRAERGDDVLVSRYVLYHPGFTRSGDRSALPPVLRGLLAVASIAAQPITDAAAPINRFLDEPPSEPLTAVDRGKQLPLSFPTLDPGKADRLMDRAK